MTGSTVHVRAPEMAWPGAILRLDARLHLSACLLEWRIRQRCEALRPAGMGEITTSHDGRLAVPAARVAGPTEAAALVAASGRCRAFPAMRLRVGERPPGRRPGVRSRSLTRASRTTFATALHARRALPSCNLFAHHQTKPSGAAGRSHYSQRATHSSTSARTCAAPPIRSGLCHSPLCVGGISKHPGSKAVSDRGAPGLR